MKKNIILCAILSFSLLSNKTMDETPQTSISNGIINARLYLPDANNGYYRGSRFDWAGVIPELEYNGHSYFGQWFENYHPTLHDAIMGPVDAFAPIGYDQAKPGESFLKIGIGMVARIDEKPYAIVPEYPIVNPGEWKVKSKKDRVQFVHQLSAGGYAYEYTKTVSLTKGKPELVLYHSLKNTGNETLETEVYNHNFFVMDNTTTGKDYTITFPFELTSKSGGNAAIGEIQGNQIVYNKDLVKGENLYYGTLQGFGNDASDYDIKIENSKTGAGVRIRCDKPLSRLVFWCAIKTVCPEPYTAINIKPGESFDWTISYEFYTTNN
ncbi:MAG: hypothetical protein O2887_10040 [Bacteroidetes bacterium]|nr:hypothetical protein [Bacteroidota bacterium]MDA1120809.1 hypothetical protein [Bacteroidota bacterium]